MCHSIHGALQWTHPIHDPHWFVGNRTRLESHHTNSCSLNVNRGAKPFKRWSMCYNNRSQDYFPCKPLVRLVGTGLKSKKSSNGPLGTLFTKTKQNLVCHSIHGTLPWTHPIHDPQLFVVNRTRLNPTTPD